MLPLIEKNDSKTRIILIAVAAVLAVALIAVVVLAFLLPEPEEKEEETQPSTVETVWYPELAVSQPSDLHVSTLQETITFAGISDPRDALTINGKEVERQEDGSFSCEVTLERGDNTVMLVNRDKTLVYTVERQAVVHSCAPMEEQSYPSGEVVAFTVIARPGSTVLVQFAQQDIVMTEQTGEAEEVPAGFVRYTGNCILPNDNKEDLDMGTVSYTVTYEGITESYTSGKITCQKKKGPLTSDPSVTPDYGKYINVGSGYIAEVITYQAETFNGKTRDDFSHTTNVYLPEGTLDYASMDLVKEKEFIYAVMRSGQRVYTQKKDKPSKNIVQVVKLYEGQLPDHNEIGFVSMEKTGHHTVLTLDCLWKAPFYLDILPQEYRNPADSAGRNYSISSFTAEYIDITFCYATQFTGTVAIPADTEVFSSAELTSRENDCTLRLYLKKTGGFYGWEAYYNENGQLCFRFLEPVKVTASDNALGADLTGVKIVIDSGHGGFDPGTVAERNGQKIYESNRNLALAKKLQQELEAAGATVVMTRSTDVKLTADERNTFLREEAPDYCVSIHHNAGGQGDTSSNGFSSHYYTPFSMMAASKVLNRTAKTNIYKSELINWHYFFVARQSVCPVVLTENGYMSNPGDLEKTLDDSVIAKKAHAIALGVADYFLEINE